VASARSCVFLNEALHLADELLDTARWHGDRCNWPEVDADSGAITPLGRGLYNGAHGITLFLTELYRVVRDERVRTAASGAMATCEDMEARAPAATSSFFGGKVGWAYLCARHFLATGDEQWRSRALEVVRDGIGGLEVDRGLDVVGGGAGAIPALLAIDEALGVSMGTQWAVALAAHLIDTCSIRPDGYCWFSSEPFPTAGDALTGFAHGASGFAMAFLLLANARGDDRFRYAAEQALKYERRHYDSELRNWRDLRHPLFSEARRTDSVDALKARARSNEQPTHPEAVCGVAWCHGAAGMAVPRAYAYRLLQDPRWLTEAHVALVTTHDVLRTGDRSDCLCHGFLGNVECAITTSRLLRRLDIESSVRHLAAERITRRRSGADPWRSGSLSNARDCGLMLGVAGMAYQCLRLADASTPSLLFPSVTRTVSHVLRTPASYSAAKAAHTRRFLAHTLQSLGSGPRSARLTHQLEQLEPPTALRTCRRILRRRDNWLHGATTVRALGIDLERAFVEGHRASRIDMQWHRWRSPNWEDAKIRSLVVSHGPRVALHGSSSEVTNSRDVLQREWITYQTIDHVEHRPIGRLTYVILRLAYTPMTINALATATLSSFAKEDQAKADVVTAVWQQLEHLYSTGILNAVVHKRDSERWPAPLVFHHSPTVGEPT